MSNYFDVVISCDLREDAPEEVINIVRCLTDRDYELNDKPDMTYEDQGNIWEGFSDYHFLASNPEHETISNFQKKWRTSIPSENDRKVYRWCLQYSGRNIHDDFWAACHVPFIYWLAAYVFEDFIGYMKHTEGGEPDLIYVKNGKLFGNAFNPPAID